MNKKIKQKKFHKVLAIVLAMIMLLLSLCSCGVIENNTEDSKEHSISTSADISGLNMALITGSVQDKLISDNYPECPVTYYPDFATCLIAVNTEKADATILPELQYDTVKADYENLAAIYPSVISSSAHFVCPKNEESRFFMAKLNEYLRKITDNGILDEIGRKWNSKIKAECFDFTELEGINGEIRVAIAPTDRPFIYISENKFGGTEAELLYGFCKEYGYSMDLAVLDDVSICASLSTEKYNIIAGFIYTEERAEMVDFSEPYMNVDQVVVVNKSLLENIPMYLDIDEINGQKIAVCTGTIQEDISRTYFTKSSFENYASYTDCLISVSEGKTEGTCVPEAQLMEMIDAFDNLTAQFKSIHSAPLYFGYPKNPSSLKLQSDFDEFLDKKNRDGKLQEMWDYWMNLSKDVEKNVYDFSQTPDINGTITVVFEPLNEPQIHKYKNGYSGYEAQLLYEFALEYGYRLDVTVMEFSALITGISSGKYDMCGNLYYTAERAENLLYSSPYLSQDTYTVVRKDDNKASSSTQNIWTRITNSFEKNFIREDRWKMMVSGLGVTIEITISTAIIGTLFGIILCFLRRGKSRLAGGLTKVFVRIMQGIPIVVLLLVMYYIIFAKSKISGIVVGIIGFSIDFGVYVSEILRSGIEAVDKGQWEAAYALGFNKYRTYTKVIIPQALQHALPVYKGQFISMVKTTSVVGYVAVQDLTKASDIIRSRTYDAFMPIIVTAVIYFILAWIMTTLLGLIELKNDPTKRKNILSNIDTSSLDLSSVKENRAEPKGKGSGDNAEEIIRIEHLRKEYENVSPLVDVNTVIRKGDVISIIGPSGTGKSTLIRMINRLEEPTSGKVYAFGKEVDSSHKEIHELRAKMTMVFQSFNLFNHLTIIENIMLAPVLIKKLPRQDAYEKGMRLLKRVGLAEKAMNYPEELSGGQKQRVAIVRALAMDPEIMLLDEPTSALDPGMINEVLHVIEDLTETGMTMLIVTHEMKFAQSVSNRVFYMDEGEIYEEGPTEQIFNNPQREKTKAFIYHLKLFSFDIDSPDFDLIKLLSKLDTFSYQQLMKSRIQYRLLLCTEELVSQGIGLLGKEHFPARLTMEYSEDNVLKASITYGGDKQDFTVNMDEISYRIIKSQTDELEYSYNNSQNEISFTIK